MCYKEVNARGSGPEGSRLKRTINNSTRGREGKKNSKTAITKILKGKGPPTKSVHSRSHMVAVNCIMLTTTMAQNSQPRSYIITHLLPSVKLKVAIANPNGFLAMF
jgi:hypothetical protein